MKSFALFIVSVTILLLNACAGTTPIQKLALPPVSTIEGSITQIDRGGFTLRDPSGSIYVRAELPGGKKLNLSVDETVRVYGNLMGGQERIFDGYVIRKSTGEQIIITKPAPHFGFIIQTAFE